MRLSTVVRLNVAAIYPSLTLLYIVFVVSRPAWRMLVLIVQFVINQIKTEIIIIIMWSRDAADEHVTKIRILVTCLFSTGT